MLSIVRPKKNPFNNYELYIQQRNKINEWLRNYQQEPDYIQRLPAEIINEDKEIKKQFNQAFSYKCSYCEVKLEENNSQLDLFRPRKVKLQNPENNLITNYNYFYHWLSWEWSNFYLACKTCNINKGKQFPVKNQRAKPGTYDTIELSKEEPLLLDPCFDNPSEHLIFFRNGKVDARKSSPRGQTTIKILDLNRRELVDARKNEADKLIKIVDSYEQEFNKKVSDMNPSKINMIMDELIPLSKDDQSFSAMKRELISELLNPFFRQVSDFFRQILDLKGANSPDENNKIATKDGFTFLPNDKFIIVYMIYNFNQYHSGSGDNLVRDKNTTNIYNSQYLSQAE